MKKFILLSIIVNFLLVGCLTLNYFDCQADSLRLIDETHSILDTISQRNRDKTIDEAGINAKKALTVIIQSHNKRTYWILATIIITSFFPFFLVFLTDIRKKKSIRKQSTELDGDEQVVYFGNVSYNPYSCLFYINNKKVKVRPLCTELLLYLINASHHYANKKEICFHLWKTDDIDTSDRLRRLICDLRKLLENNKANILIEAVANGYQLKMKETL